jgi:hypothetical protein
MTTKKRIRTVLTLAAVAMAILVLATASARAATMSSSATAPVVDGEDIASYGTPTGQDKWWPEGANPYGDPGKTVGQTFTTGSADVLLNGFTFQIRDATQPTKTYTIRVGTVSGTTFTQIASETATQSFATAADDYWTWTLDSPVLLSANTVYGVDVGLNSSTSDWTTGIPYVYYTADEYVGGTRFRSGTALGYGVGDTSMTQVSGDRVFHIDLSSGDPNLPSVDAGADMITWSGEPVTMDPNVVNNDTNEPQGTLTYLWTAEPNGIGDPDLDVKITDADQEVASVEITKTAPTGDATVVTMTLAVTLQGKDPVTDTMTIDVYDDSCLAAKAAGLAVIDPTDSNQDCVTNFEDFAVMATTWLDDYTLTEPVPK